jgi:GntR family transcriptional regulator
MVRPRRNTIPLHAQIAASLRAEMETGTWPVGAKLPAIDEMAHRYGVAPLTMRQALTTLEDQGLILCRQGVGTIVQKEPRDQRWLNLPTDWTSLVGMLDKLDVRMTLVEASDRWPHLRPEDGGSAVSYKFLKRVHYRNEEPFCVIELFLSGEIYMRAPKQFRSQIVVPLLARMECIDISKVRQKMSIDAADAETAKLLDVPLAGPIARVRRTIADATGTVIYIAEALYRSDVVHLEMDLSPPQLSHSTSLTP